MVFDGILYLIQEMYLGPCQFDQSFCETSQRLKYVYCNEVERLAAAFIVSYCSIYCISYCVCYVMNILIMKYDDEIYDEIYQI